MVMGIMWTPKQVEVYLACLKGGTISEITGQTHSSYATVTKIKAAISKGEHPPSYPPPDQEPKNTALAVGTPKNKDKNASNPDNIKQASAQTTPEYAGLDQATVGKLFPQTVYIPITPIMLSARNYVVQRLKWSTNVKWQDLIDTVFFNYFKSLKPSVHLHGWVEEEAPSDSPKPASGSDNGKGNGDIDVNDPKVKQIIESVAKELALKFIKESTTIGGSTLGGEDVTFT